jgi:hypothetical protein
VPALGEYPNVWDSALAVLEEKGWQVWRNPTADLYCAERDGWDFTADTPISLLGLVALYEHRRPDSYSEYWWRARPRRAGTDLPTSPPDYTPVWARR